jgi:hypothetical protein
MGFEVFGYFLFMDEEGAGGLMEREVSVFVLFGFHAMG